MLVSILRTLPDAINQLAGLRSSVKKQARLIQADASHQ